MKYPLMGIVCRVPRRNATVGEDPSRSSTWVISPILLWEKAQLGTCENIGCVVPPHKHIRNSSEFSDLRFVAENNNSASLCGPVRALSLAEAVVKQTLKLALALLLVVAAAILPLAAAEHPVKLEKDADCASCHEDKTKGKAVHSAIPMGCAMKHFTIERGRLLSGTSRKPGKRPPHNTRKASETAGRRTSWAIS